MACLIDLCFALEFSFKPSNLRIVSDCRCWKAAIPYCRQRAKAERVIHIRETKRFATALSEIRAGGGSASWELEADGWFWDVFLRPSRCWDYGGSCWRCLRVGCPHGSTDLLPSVPHPGTRSPALPWERVNLHTYYRTGGVGNCQAGAGSLQRWLQGVASNLGGVVLGWTCWTGHTVLQGTEQGGLVLWENAS